LTDSPTDDVPLKKEKSMLTRCSSRIASVRKRCAPSSATSTGRKYPRKSSSPRNWFASRKQLSPDPPLLADSRDRNRCDAEYEYCDAGYEYSNAEYEYRDAEYEYCDAEYEYRDAEYEYRNAEYEYRDAEYEYRNAEYEYRNAEYEYRNAEHEYRNAEYEYE
jgi:hypothetical protein